MNKDKYSILFFTPSLERVGSEVALFNLISRSSEKFNITAVMKHKGSLIAHLPSSIKTICYYEKMGNETIAKKAIKKIRRKVEPEIFLTDIERRYKGSVWYINTITQPDVLRYAKNRGIPVILHVHELEHMYASLSAEDVKLIIEYPRMIIATSHHSAEVLRNGGRKNNLVVCYPLVDVEKINSYTRNQDHLRQKLKIAENSFIWAMSGTLDTNKNPYLFVDIARQLLSMDNNAHFIWLNSRISNDGYSWLCKQKAIEYGISNKILWIDNPGEMYHDYFSIANGFVLTSYKESFSIVAAEALSFGIPVVSTDCGGTREIITSDIGRIVKSYDPVEIATSMFDYMNGKASFNAKDAHASMARFDFKKGLEEWHKIINNCMLELNI